MRWKAAAQAVSWILELSDSVCSLKGSIGWHIAASLLMLRRRKEKTGKGLFSERTDSVIRMVFILEGCFHKSVLSFLFWTYTVPIRFTTSLGSPLSEVLAAAVPKLNS